MIPYDELVAALDRYVARNGGTPTSVRASAAAAYVPAAQHDDEPHATDVPMGSFDEPHDPDMPRLSSHGGDEDSTHVGASPGGASLPPPLQPSHDDPSNEIDIGDVLADDEL